MQNKDNLVSFLQAFGIVLVVLGHSHQGAPADPLWHTWIYSFHMPLFMFISGFLLRYTNERKGISLATTPLRGFMWKKAKRLLVPYVVISSLAFVPKVLLSRFAARPLEFSLHDYAQMLIYPWDNVIVFFWFLPTLFLIFFLVICGAHLLKHIHSEWLHGILLLALLLLHLFNPLKEIRLLNINGVVNYLIYFALGYYVCRYHITKHINNHLHPGLLLTGALSILFVTVIPNFWGKSLLMAANGILLSLLLGQLYVRKQWHFLHHLFGASYAIYLFSWFPQVASQQVLLALTHAPWQVGGLLAFFTGIYIPLLIYKWIVRHKKGRIGRYVALLAGHA